MSKHKKTVYAGNTPRGPQRWARAYANLLENPNSQAAALLMKRLKLAHDYVVAPASGRMPFEHVTAFRDGERRNYATCSQVCAIMCIQLDTGIETHHDLYSLFAGEWRRTYTFRGVTRVTDAQPVVRVLDTSTLRRSMRCQHCGTKVLPR